MINIINIEKFLIEKREIPVVDVRSPIEYTKGHVPGSVNIPLFSDEERAHIGTVYKQQGSDTAVNLGESYAEPKIKHYLQSVNKVSPHKNIIVYCFRGGMRSQRFSSLLEENGFSVSRLESGYKSYRKHVRESFSKKYPLRVIGGKTGSGKTEILEELKKKKEQVVDLEMLANHRGSAFGSMDDGWQPTSEHFENILFEHLGTLSLAKDIWIEDESLSIGRVFIPEDFYRQMKFAPLIVLKVPKSQRVERLCRDYINQGKVSLLSSVERIGKRLGSERTTLAREAIEKNDYERAASIILEYYDKCYDYGLSKKENVTIDFREIEVDNPNLTASDLLSN